jgi:hypothetical protein
MDCHESLMARRRKKTARNAAQRQKPSGAGVKLDKSLPSLPPSALAAVNAPKSAFSPDVETPPSDTYSDTPTEIPSRYRSLETRSELSKKSRRDGSPASQTQAKGLFINSFELEAGALIAVVSRYLDPPLDHLQEQSPFGGVKQV